MIEVNVTTGKEADEEKTFSKIYGIAGSLSGEKAL